MVILEEEARHIYRPRGSAIDLFETRDGETLLAGPAGTGKSRACLEWLNLVMCKYPGARALMARKVRRSLTQSGMVTFKEYVMPGIVPRPKFHTGDQAYRYSNGSQIVVAGFDDPEKIKSTEFDVAYVQEATELTEEDWEILTTRAGRWRKVPYGRIVGDCNPAGPTHWLRRRAEAGKLRLMESVHEDNPVLYNAETKEWTERGMSYLGVLDQLSGVRLQRLRFGRWAAAEGLIYEGWDRSVHLIDRVPFFGKDQDVDGAGVPHAWPRYWAIDFGYENPFVLQCWAQDPDGRLYRYRELYGTHQLVEDWARLSIASMASDEPRPQAIVCDHDAEDRKTFERHSGMSTEAARKDVSTGIQAVQARFRVAGDGKARLFLIRDGLLEQDQDLASVHKPTCSEEEIDGYVWAKTPEGKASKEQPDKIDDHGMDAMRYMVAHFDLGMGGMTLGAGGGTRDATHRE